MPTLRERKNPSSGTKVHPGKNDPVHREAAGLVAPESLAAESVEHGGEFAQNRNVQQEGVESSGLKTQSGREGGEAPGYVADQYIKDTKGPHGKNIKEGVDEGKAGEKNDGLQRALRSEPGSEDDPSRLAEAQMFQKGSLGARGAGPRQSHLEGETIYDKLDSETSSWLRHLFDRYHSRIFTFRENHHPEDGSFYGKTYEDMPVIPEEKSSLRPPRPSDVDSGKQNSISGPKQEEEARRDASRNTNVPSEQDVEAEEMEHQRYGEAQPQLVPTDMIETMISAQGRKKESPNDG
ncbi:hypothetical protein CI102_1563 [Trichoderma harzianum]|nr:hypothetical protein CI102_1563 [Trichoderma harzianum]